MSIFNALTSNHEGTSLNPDSRHVVNSYWVHRLLGMSSKGNFYNRQDSVLSGTSISNPDKLRKIACLEMDLKVTLVNDVGVRRQRLKLLFDRHLAAGSKSAHSAHGNKA